MKGRPSDLAGWRFGASLLAAAALIAGTTACGDSQPADSTSASTQPQQPVPVSPQQRAALALPAIRSVPERVQAAFSVFRSPPEGLPLDVKQTLRQPTYGAKWALAQRLSGTPWPAWAIPGRGFVCLVDQQARGGGVGQVCTTTKRLLANGAFKASISAPPQTGQDNFAASKTKPAKRVVFGLAPDGVRIARVNTPGFASGSAPVDRNVFVLRDKTDSPPETITLVR
jgi:hypothetical protein